MQASFSESWQLIRHAAHTLKLRPSLVIPTAFSRLFKFFFITVIVMPLIKGYEQGNSLANLKQFLNQWGINLYDPAFYLILLLLFFAAYCISRVIYGIEFNSLLHSFRTHHFSLRYGLKHLRLKSLLAFCFINKTWGVVVRFLKPWLKDTNWTFNIIFALALIVDKQQSSVDAIKNSKTLVETHFGKNPRYSLLLLKPALVLLLLIALPAIIGLMIGTQQTVWLGSLISLGTWYFYSVIESVLILILFTAFYEQIVNNKPVPGFNEKILRQLFIK
ncbi:MAG TPA: hypothetical protein VD770_02165 [Coxiellaceae bacterium]|nr:hypothetical protein [Coxiellaceae bacterium]